MIVSAMYSLQCVKQTIPIMALLAKIFVIERASQPHPIQNGCFPQIHTLQSFGEIIDIW
jgi:hypothetical protein